MTPIGANAKAGHGMCVAPQEQLVPPRGLTAGPRSYARKPSRAALDPAVKLRGAVLRATISWGRRTMTGDTFCALHLLLGTAADRIRHKLLVIPDLIRDPQRLTQTTRSASALPSWRQHLYLGASTIIIWRPSSLG